MEQSLATVVLRAPAEVLPEVKPRISRRLFDSILLTAAFVIIVAGIHLAQSALVPILLSIFIAVLAAAPLRWLKKKHIPSGISVVLVALAVVLVISLFLFLIALSVRSITDALPEYQHRFQGQMAQVKTMLEHQGIQGTDKLFQNLITPEAAAGFAVGFLSSVAAAFSSIVLILLTVIFILLEASSFPVKLRAAIGDPLAAFPKFAIFANDIKRVVVIQTVISLSTGILMGIWLTILGVDFTIMLGLLTFLFNFIPNIGSIIAAVPAILVTFIQFGIGRALLAALGFIAVGTLVGNVLQPRLMGQKLGLSSLVVFLSVLFWGSLLGPIGMMLCVPFTLAVKFALESSPRTKWMALLLERVPVRPKASAASSRKG
ncbi:MAG: AI-2E family transporter [Acidobacteriota bacterium]